MLKNDYVLTSTDSFIYARGYFNKAYTFKLVKMFFIQLKILTILKQQSRI